MSPLFSVAIDPIILNLQIKSKCISSMCLNFGQIGPQVPATDLAALERLKLPSFTYRVSTFSRLFSYFRTVQNIFIILLAGSQVSDRCPFAFLSYFCSKIKIVIP